MIDFSYKKQNDLISLLIKTDSTEVGTLYRITACLYALKLDIISGEIQTIEENGKHYTLDSFLIQSEDENTQAAFQLGVLMDMVFSKQEDINKLLESFHLVEPPTEVFFRENPEFIFTDDPESKSTCFYLESGSGRGLLYHITRILMKHGVDIQAGKIETDTELGRAKDTFYLRDNQGKSFGNTPLVETLRKEILRPAKI
jgi:UTP:GlnB (protein PII) uridylyltransferase